MLIDMPPTIPSADERKVDQAEQDERCLELVRKGQLLKQQFPTRLMNTESITYSTKYGYILSGASHFNGQPFPLKIGCTGVHSPLG